jgi:hypothetical protein
LVLKGIRQAAFVNVVTTIAKLVPLVLFILVAIVAFNWDKFTFDFWGARASPGTIGLGSVVDQVKSTMIVTLWVFIGIEGASVYSARAARRSDVGRATVIGFVGALGIYVLVSLLATGVLSQPELAGLKVPSMAGVFESLVGPWGAALINIGLVISVGGAFLSWTLLCAEIPYTCGKDGTFPKWFAFENKNGSPANSLWTTNVLIQLFVLSFLEERLSVLLLHRIGRNPAAVPAHGRLRAEAGRDRRRLRRGRNPREGRHRGRGSHRLRPVARLCRGAVLPPDVRRSVCAGNPDLRKGQGRERAARLRALRGRDSERHRGAGAARRLAHVDRKSKSAVIFH